MAQSGQRSRAETFVLRLQLFQDIQPRSFLGLLTQQPVQFLRAPVDLLLEFAQPALPLLDAAATGLSVELFGLDVGRKPLRSRNIGTRVKEKVNKCNFI